MDEPTSFLNQITNNLLRIIVFDKKYKMKLLTAVIAIACTMNPPASCFAKAGAVGGAATDVIQEEVKLVVVNSGSVSSK